MLKRKGLLCGVGVAVALAGIGVVVLPRMLQREAPQPSPDAMFDLWHRDLFSRTATDAAKEWQETLVAMGGKRELLAPEKRQDAYRMLGVLFFGEGKYEEAFEMYREEATLRKAAPRGVVLYCAALSGRSEWLKALQGRESENAPETRKRLLLACSAWAKGEFADVVKIGSEGQQLGHGGDSASRSDAAWLRLLVGRGQLELSRYEDAFDSLFRTSREDVEALEPPNFIAVHLAGFLIDAAESLGRYEDALLIAEVMERNMELRDVRAWEGAIKKIDDAAKRLRARAEDSAPPLTDG